MRFAISISAAFFVTLALFYLMQQMIRGDGERIEKPENYRVVDFVRLQSEPDDTKSTPQREPLPRKPSPPPGAPAVPEMALAAAQPPATPQSKPMREPVRPMQLGKPYLGPLTAVIPKSVAPKKPAVSNKRKAPAMPVPMQKSEVKQIGLASRDSVEREIPKTTLASLGQQPIVGLGLPGAGGDHEGDAVPVFKQEPRYPRKAAKSRIEGWVKVEFTITAKGTVTDAVVVNSRPRRTFDRSAVQSIRKWRFKPRVVAGRPVQRKASQLIEFKLAKG